MTITITQINGMPITVNAETPVPIVLNMALAGAQGVGISNVIINELNELIVTLTNGTVLNAGVIISTGGEGVTMTPAQILAAIKTVDGLGSGLDADLLDGQNGTYYLSWNNTSDKPSPVITLSGDATGSVTLANLASGALPVTVVDNSHNHTIANVSGLQTAIDGKADDVHAHTPSDITGLDTAITNNTTVTANTTAKHAHANKTILDNVTASYTTEEQTKLAGIEAGATADQSASEILNSLKTVDGTGSELDADLLDGHDSSYFAPAATTYTKTEVDTAVGNVSIPLASAEVDGKMSASDFNKLAGVETNANNYSHPTGDGNSHVPATGTSNNGKVLTAGSEAGSTSWRALTKSSVGLANVDNTADADKPISTAQQTALTDFAGISPPQLPVTNGRWLDTSTTPPVLKRYNGTTWVNEYIQHSVTADNAGLKNKIINGNFAVNQRVVSGTVTLAAGKYGHDRWKAGSSGCTYTFATVANVTTLTITAGSLIQIVEGINLQSGTHVLSWTGTAQGKIGAGSYGASGVTGTATGGTNLTVEFNAGTLANVQLEFGQIATEFERRPVTIETMLCQRYYQLLTVCGVANSTSVVALGTMFPVPMRTIPTIPLTELTASPYGTANVIFTPTEFGPVAATWVGYIGAPSNTFTVGRAYKAEIKLNSEL